MVDIPLQVGQTVLSQDGRQGVIRFRGTSSFAPGTWLGLELPDNKGKNDGSVKGERYFDCRPGHGIFVRPESIVQIISQSSATTNGHPLPKVNGSTSARPRPSIGVTADVARKRQSLMSSGSTPGSRVSLRLKSPTKSPTKHVTSSGSSATTTPRTSTPTTTNRTSDSSVKSRLSTNGRLSMGPPLTKPSTSKPPRQSLLQTTKKTSGVTSKPPTSGPTRSSLAPRTRQSLAPQFSSTPSRTTKPPETEAPDPIDDNKDEELDAIELEKDGGAVVAAEAQLPQQPQTSSMDDPGGTRDDSSLIVSRASRRPSGPSSFEGRAAAQRELEQLKAKIRTLEQKRQEDNEKIRSADDIQKAKDRFEQIIQVLQKKLYASQQEMSELRNKLKTAEAQADHSDRTHAETDPELELATLDREMAEERAETLQVELDILKAKHEELELEAEVLREENQELSSVMSPEEKASAGWLQMEREKDRLRNALVMLRDISQQTEVDLRSQVKDLERELREFDEVSSRYHEANEQLAQSNATNKHLMDQLEAAESYGEINLALQLEKDHYLEQIEQLSRQVQTLQEEANVNDELEMFHIETEKDLQEELDSQQALLNEHEQTSAGQNKVIDDLEYTLSKFRDVVSALQGDINEMRIARNITESEANEMSNKSRAMMELNLKLQKSATKNLTKAIDFELDRVKAEESSEHLSIIQLFLSDSFAMEKDPILALMCFKRINAKSKIIYEAIRDQTRDSNQNTQEDFFEAFELLRRLQWMSTCCGRVESYMSTCSVTDFSRCATALYELRPVERAVDFLINALKANELNAKHAAEELWRMNALLSDLAEKLVKPNPGSTLDEILAQSLGLECRFDIMNSYLGAIRGLMLSQIDRDQSPQEEIEYLELRLDQFISKARTLKYLTSKSSEELKNRRLYHLTLSEQSWDVFEPAEELANQLYGLLKKAGEDLLSRSRADEPEAGLMYAEMSELITKSANLYIQSNMSERETTDDALSYIESALQTLYRTIDSINNTINDDSQFLPFHPTIAPWKIRAQELRDRKVIPPEAEETLRKLTAKVKEQIATLNDKNRRLEEDAIKIELLESRTKDSKQFSATLQKLEAELASAKVEKSSAEAHVEKFMQEFARVKFEHDATQRELESLRQNVSSDGSASVTKRRSGLVEDSTTRLRLTVEIEALATEILSLQSAVRYLKAENHKLRLIVPPTNSRPTGNLSWLESADLSRARRARGGASPTGSEEDVLDALIHLATSTQPLPMMHGEDKADSAGKPSWWRPTQTTARYAALKRRTEWEAWREWKEEGTGRGRVRCRCDAAVTGVKGLPGRGPGKHVAGHEAAGHDGVVVVGSP